MRMRTPGSFAAAAALSLVACSTGRLMNGAAGSNGAAGTGAGAAGGAGGDVGGSPGTGSGGEIGGGGEDGGVDMVDLIDPNDLGPPPDLGPPAPFQALAPGEHPRLFFRPYDLPMLKAKAATPQGAVLIATLKDSLGGGEAMRQDMADFTLWDAFGFGVLYQITGDQKYADLCQQATQLVLDGATDRGKQYNWLMPDGYMDVVGGTLTSVAMAYDVCYPGWPAAFSAMVAQKMLTYQCANLKIEGWPTSGDVVTLEQMALTPPGDPGQWTFGSVVAGAGLVTLATMGDPGVDAAQSAKLLAGVQKGIDRVLTDGWGDMGAFNRMAKQGEIVSNTGFVPLVQAMRVALNKDYVAEKPGVEWMTLHWVFDLVADPGGKTPRFPDRHDAPDLYDQFVQRLVRYGGTFEQGFAAVSEAMKPAILWTIQTLKLEPMQETDYPQHPAFAFINAPFGPTPVNPGQLLPHVMQDHVFGVYEFRNKWQDANDIIVTTALGGSPDEGDLTSVIVWGFGFRTTFGSLPHHMERPRPEMETLVASKDGSGVLSVGGSSLAVDFSGTSGAEALLAFVGSRDDLSAAGMRHEDFGARAASTTVMLGTTPVYVMTLQSGAAPVVTVAANKIAAGNQTISWNGATLSFGTMSP